MSSTAQNTNDSFGINLGQILASTKAAPAASKPTAPAVAPKQQNLAPKRGLVKPTKPTPSRVIDRTGQVHSIKPHGKDLRDTIKVAPGQGTQGRVLYTKAKHVTPAAGKKDLRATLQLQPKAPSPVLPSGMKASDKVPYGKVRVHYGVDSLDNPSLAILPMVAGEKGIHSHPHLRIPEGGFARADMSTDAYHDLMLLVIRFNQIHDRVVLVSAAEAARQFCSRDDSKARIILPNGFGPVQMPAPTASGPVEFLDVNDANDVGTMEILTPGLNGWLLDHGVDLHGLRMLSEDYRASSLHEWNRREVMMDKVNIYRLPILAETRDWGAGDVGAGDYNVIPRQIKAGVPDRPRGVTKSATGQTQKCDLWVAEGRDVIEPSVAANITAAAVYQLVEYSNSQNITQRRPHLGVQLHPEEAEGIRLFFDRAGIMCAAPKKKAGVVSGAAKRPSAKWKNAAPAPAFA